MNLKQIRESNKETGEQLAKVLNLTKPLISYIENNIVLLTPPCLKKVCKRYNCKRADIYSDDEINFGLKKAPQGAVTWRGLPSSRKLCVRFSNSGYNLLELALKELNYQTKQAWVEECFKKLVTKYQKVIIKSRGNYGK